MRRQLAFTLFPYTTLFRSHLAHVHDHLDAGGVLRDAPRNARKVDLAAVGLFDGLPLVVGDGRRRRLAQIARPFAAATLAVRLRVDWTRTGEAWTWGHNPRR